MPNEESNQTKTEENLIVKESPAGNKSILVEELGHFGYVIYKYWKRPFWSELEDEIKKLDKDQLNDIIEEIQTTAEHKEGIEHNGIDNTSQDFVIDDKDTGAAFLCERISELETRYEEMRMANPTPIDLAKWRFNKKAAKRRLRRWIKEQDDDMVKVPMQYTEIFKRVIDEGPEDHIDVRDPDWIDKMLWEDGYIEDVRDYWQRKIKSVILIVHEIPHGIQSLLNEACEAYYHRLYRATAALCRSMLEDLLRRIVLITSAQYGPIPITDESLEVLINCMPSQYLRPDEIPVAHEIRKRGNQALHDQDVYFSEKTAWYLLTESRKLLERLINRGGLAPDKK